MSQDFFIGIDLGTSNTALGRCADDGAAEAVPIYQLQDHGAFISAPTLPSVLYLPDSAEAAASGLRLPWQAEAEPQVVLGHWAQGRGAQVPDRFIASAKSWLCQKNIDPTQAILPWGSQGAVKYSPLAASQLYLSYLQQAFDHQYPEQTLSQAKATVITIPAAFDERARELTLEAARQAGLKEPVLLEEPLAALYAWISDRGEAWRQDLVAGDVVLVCDVGGGTTDFSLITVKDEQGDCELHRIAVGPHLLLGGDNMDLALTYALADQLSDQGVTLDEWQFRSLVYGVKAAKEKIFSEPECSEVPLTVASRGSNLFASAVSVVLQRDLLEQVVLQGFLPEVPATAALMQQGAEAMQELGLAYEQDPVITKHLVAFLRQAGRQLKCQPEALSPALQSRLHTLDDESDILLPNKVLFNGGVLKASAVQVALRQSLCSWHPCHEAPVVLAAADHDLAVARGAAYYARLKSTGQGLRIRAGTARSYYIGIKETRPAVPGLAARLKGVCIVPQGTEEGSVLSLAQRSFGLVTGRDVAFEFFTSQERPEDEVGTVVGDALKTLESASQVKVCWHDDEKQAETTGAVIPVTLQACVNEIGVLDLALKAQNSDQQWKLAHDVRDWEQR